MGRPVDTLVGGLTGAAIGGVGGLVGGYLSEPLPTSVGNKDIDAAFKSRRNKVLLRRALFGALSGGAIGAIAGNNKTRMDELINGARSTWDR